MRSDIERRKPDKDDAQLAMSMVNYRELLKKPLLALPLEVRQAALCAWAIHRHLPGMESAMSISGAVAVWISQYDLHPDDANAALRAMTAPSKMGTHKFASDLMTDLAAEVSEHIKRRKIIREQEERRKASEEALKDPPTQEDFGDLRDLLEGFGKPKPVDNTMATIRNEAFIEAARKSQHGGHAR
jgi:hypothetical protein